MRIHHIRPNEKYVKFAEKIAEIMPTVGMDIQRGGWYDVMEREVAEGEKWHRYVWHDRKAWWQQEQGILAYLILAGSLGKSEYRRLARESSAFYNAWFPDHDSGGVYFNVLANGLPYLLGTERLKGSHSMSGYHSFELCYLAAVYTNLLITKQPMDFYFKPKPGGFKDNILRVAPDMLPPGSIRIQEVWINGERYTDFDAEALTVNLPDTDSHPLSQRPGWAGNPNMLPSAKGEMKIRVRIAPAGVSFDAILDIDGSKAVLTLEGNLDAAGAEAFQAKLNKIMAAQPSSLVVDCSDLESISRAGARALDFARQKLGLDTEITIAGANESVKHTFASIDFLEEVKVA
jgi:anti-anti-sigma factor